MLMVTLTDVAAAVAIIQLMLLLLLPPWMLLAVGYGYGAFMHFYTKLHHLDGVTTVACTEWWTLNIELVSWLCFCQSNCKPCPVAKPTFLCGNDNRTYSSLCRLDYHNCIHSTTIRIACKGFCPCKGKFYSLLSLMLSLAFSLSLSLGISSWWWVAAIR